MSFLFTKKEKDPVCGMSVDPKKAAATHQYEGKTYYFCAMGCQQGFVQDPKRYLKAIPQPQKSGGMDSHMGCH